MVNFNKITKHNCYCFEVTVYLKDSEVIALKVVLQRVTKANVRVDGTIVGDIDQGLVILVGITPSDDIATIQKIAKKCIQLRMFEDEHGKLNKSLYDVQGGILSISQFTLYGDCKKGRRPSFDQAAKGEIAKPLYDAFNEALSGYGMQLETGIFGADMQLELVNDGPVTIVIDSAEL